LKAYVVGVGILILILVLMAFGERFFCQFLCPMGAIFSLLPVLPLMQYRRDRKNCIPGCSACKKNCPVRMEIDGDSKKSGECIQCDTCVGICPKGNISRTVKGPKGADILFILIKTAILMAVCIYFF
ncbi:MAG: 4Fe-4S binding protein, partial [Lachnospiraceae bacterium]|nr:4Fe-4S binding protein [Lachnospiraceae bacterium]